jgi:hypothetical protein
MQRFKGYLNVIAWQTGVAYLLLWMVTFWTLYEGASVFANSGVCYPDTATVLFYWVCTTRSPLAILASVANVALTATVWAPVYIAAATVKPEAISIALPIIALHVVGLPLALFVLVRLLATAFDLRRGIRSGRGPVRASAAAATGGSAAAAGLHPMPHPVTPRPARKIKARSEFGLRSQKTLAASQKSQRG